MGLSSFLQIQSLGKSQRIAITLMRSEQPRSSLRHHRTTGGQHPHAKLYPLPLASSKNHLKSAETNLRPKLQLFCDYGLSQGAKRGFWSENAENQPRKGPFLPCGKQAGVPNRKKVAKALSFFVFAMGRLPQQRQLSKDRSPQRRQILRKTQVTTIPRRPRTFR